MSRSYKKHAYVKWCGGSDAEWKKDVARLARSKIHQMMKMLEKDTEGELDKNLDLLLPCKNEEVSDLWSAPSDGGVGFCWSNKNSMIKERENKTYWARGVEYFLYPREEFDRRWLETIRK
jgi:hypothetical protein